MLATDVVIIKHIGTEHGGVRRPESIPHAEIRHGSVVDPPNPRLGKKQMAAVFV